MSYIQHQRAKYPPQMSAKDKHKYVFPDTTWIWNAKPGACDACIALDGKKFYSFELPDKPHPNCKCVAEITAPKQVFREGQLAGFEASAKEIFSGKNTIKVTLRNLNVHLAEIQFIVRNKNLLNKRVSSGAIVYGNPVEVFFTHPLTEPVPWNVFMVLKGGDNTIITYKIEG